MKAKRIQNVAADDELKYAAAINARMTSIVNQTHFSQAKQRAAERMKLGLEMCYSARQVYVTYRKKFIAVKVDGITGIANKASLRLLEADYAAAGYEKVESQQGVTYRIPA